MQPSKSAVTHERIIHAAAEVLAERGYAGTRLSDIAERAGIQSGSLYYHFEDRDDIVDQVLQRGVRETRRRVQEAIDALPADADHRRRLETAIVAHLGVILEFGEVSSASLQLVRQLPPELHIVLERRLQAAIRHKPRRRQMLLAVHRRILQDYSYKY